MIKLEKLFEHNNSQDIIRKSMNFNTKYLDLIDEIEPIFLNILKK